MNLHEFFQLGVSGFIQGTSFGLLGVGFGLIFSVTGRFHFAFASSFTITAYVAIEVVDRGGPLAVGILAGLASGIALGLLVERFLYQPMAARLGTAGPFTIFVAALGVTTFAENGVNLVWGGQGRSLTGIALTPIRLGHVSFLRLDLGLFVLAWVVVIVLQLALRRTRRGRMILAVRVNPEMSRVVGIRPTTIYLWVFAIGTAVGGVVALYTAVKFAATPEMGTSPLFDAFLVVFLGGYTRGPVALLTTGIALGLVQNLSQLWLPAQWAPVVIFGVLLIYLVLRAIGTPRLRRLLPPPRVASA